MNFNMSSRVKDLTGLKFGRLNVLKFSHTEKEKAYWVCNCDCGNKENIIVKSINLTSGSKRSCGCLAKDQLAEIKITSDQPIIRGIKMSNKLLHKKKLMDVWNSMKKRCYNPNMSNYYRYGGRGITVCKEWLDLKSGFLNFYTWAIDNNYEEGLTIDRVDTNGNYEPSNCAWATRVTQQNNRRNNILVTIRNKTQTLAEWAREYDIPYNIIILRYNKGITGKELIEPPPEIFMNSNIDVNGVIHTAKEWVKIIGISPWKFRLRYERGDRGEFLVREVSKIITEVRGELLGLSQISKKYNIIIGTIQSRYRRGKRGEDLIRPVDK